MGGSSGSSGGVGDNDERGSVWCMNVSEVRVQEVKSTQTEYRIKIGQTRKLGSVSAKVWAWEVGGVCV